MNAVLLKEDFEKNISIAGRFISSRPQLPILSNILLSFENGKVKISSTNLEVSITLWGGSDVKEKGICTVSARTLSEVLSNLSAGRIELSEKEGVFKITEGGSSISLPTTPDNDFPKIISVVPKEHTAFPIALLNDIVRQVIFAASQDETKPVFSGVLFSQEKDHIDVVATNGVRLSQKQISTKTPLGKEKLIIPAKTLQEISRIFSHNKQDALSISTNFEEGYVIFGQDNVVLTTRIIDGDFPDFEKIIPQKRETRVLFDKEELIKVVQLASVFAQDYKVEMSIEDKTVTFSSQHPQLGNQASVVNAKVEGNEMKVAFNWRFIKDFIGSVVGDEIIIDLTDPTSPGVFRDPKDDSYLHLIMPIRTVEEN